MFRNQKTIKLARAHYLFIIVLEDNSEIWDSDWILHTRRYNLQYASDPPQNRTQITSTWCTVSFIHALPYYGQIYILSLVLLVCVCV